MSILKKSYEISVWDDIWNGEKFVEQKLGVIGSDLMETQCRVISPNLTRNTNGTKKFSFQLYKKYKDNITGEWIENPFCNWLINERKVKLKYKEKWYDFVIKNIKEDSTKYLNTYQLEDAFVQELSKNGFKVELDDSLMNNSGTANQLAAKVLEDTDWTVSYKSEAFVEGIEESLVYLRVKNSHTLKAFRVSDQNPTNYKEGVTVNKEELIAAGSIILGFYSSCTNKPYRFQFIYVGDLNNLSKDSNRIITNTDCQYYIDNPIYTEGTTLENNLFSLPLQLTTTTVVEPGGTSGVMVSGEYRARRYGFSQQSVFVPVLGKYVNRYVYAGSEGADFAGNYYGYLETEYVSPALVQNVISNTTFKNTSGWIGTRKKGGGLAKVENVVGNFSQGKFNELISNFSTMLEEGFSSYMKLTFENSLSFVLNSGPRDSRSLFAETYVGDEWGVVCEALGANGQPIDLNFSIAEYEYIADDKAGGLNFYKPKLPTPITFKQNDTTPTGFSAVFTITKRDPSATQYLKKNSQLFLSIAPSSDDVTECYIQSISLFKIVRDENGLIIYPEKQAANITQRAFNTNYCFFKEGAEQGITDPDNLPITHVMKELDYKTFLPVMVPGAQKIRNVSAKESNYFNILQNIAETFEAWLDFDIQRDEDSGAVLSKQILFRNYVGKDNPVGIKYGINLKNIQRTFESKQLVTKLLVKDNNNEFANNGFCSIGKAASNPTGENYIYDFQYFFNCGLLNARDYLDTLYSWDGAKGKDISDQDQGYNLKGYFPRVKNLNIKIAEASSVLVNKLKDETTLSAKQQVAEAGYQAALSGMEQCEVDFQKASEGKTGSIKNSSLEDYANNGSIKKILTEYATFYSEYENYYAENTRLTENLEKIRTKIADLKLQIEQWGSQKQSLNKLFYSKYSRFIQEGTWIDEKYTDDNTYYTDALSVMYNSCYPKAAYTINVVGISAIPGYEDFSYDLGDKTFVVDDEFFGKGVKMEIVVTEISENLDDPTQDKLKVQTFKNQFQDLFQRITATVQTAQYNTGAYEKAVALAEASQERKNQFVTDALAGAATRLQVAGQQSVVFGEDGITITDVDSPSDSIRMIGGAILLSKQDANGNQKWTTGITSDGMSANLITAGVLNAGEISIMNYDEPVFRWDSYGISAFDAEWTAADGAPVVSAINSDKFVRFDKYGIYGINGSANGLNWRPTGENYNDEPLKEIYARSTFSLTWEGLRVSHLDSYVHVGVQKDDDSELTRLISISDGQKETFFVDGNGNVTMRGNLMIGVEAEGGTNEITAQDYIANVKTEAKEYADGWMNVNGNFSWKFDKNFGFTMWSGEQKEENIVFQFGKQNGENVQYMNGTGVFNGEIVASKGRIGGDNGWVINTNYIGSSIENKGSFYLASAGDNSSYWLRAHNSHNGGGQRTFSISKEGQLYASGADISGKITATEGFIGPSEGESFRIGEITMIPTGDKHLAMHYGLVYQSSEDYYKVTDGKYLMLLCPYGVESESVLVEGGATDDLWIFLAGRANQDKVPFGVRDDGALYASAGKIGGWKINSDKLSYSTYSIGATNSFVLAPGGQSGTINGQSASWKLAIGGNFGVTNKGEMYSSAGYIGGFTIDGSSLRATDTSSTGTNAIYANGLKLSDNVSAPVVLMIDQEKDGAGNVTFSGAIFSNGQGFFTHLAASSATIQQSLNVALVNASAIQTTALYANEISASSYQSEKIVTNKIVSAQNSNCYLNMWYDPGSSSTTSTNFKANVSVFDGWLIQITIDKPLHSDRTFTVYFKNIFGLEATSFAMTVKKGETLATKQTGIVFRTNKAYFNSSYTETEITFSQTKTDTVSNRGGIDSHASINPYSVNTYDLGNSTYYWRSLYVNTSYYKTASVEWSDRRFKRDISRITNKYDEFYDDLSPTEYRMQDGKRRHFGLVADDLKENLQKYKIDTNDFAPFVEFHLHDEQGRETEETRYGIRYTELISLNIDQIQKLKKRVKQLEEKIEVLTRIKN